MRYGGKHCRFVFPFVDYNL